VAKILEHVIEYPDFHFFGHSEEIEPNRFLVESQVNSKIGMRNFKQFEAVMYWNGKEWVLEGMKQRRP